MKAPVRLTTILGVLLFSVAHVSAQRGNPDVIWEGRSVDDLIAEYMRENEVPGMTIAIVQAPYITRDAGFGVADQESSALASTRTLFDIGEMKSGFTAVAVMQLVEDGKLDLDATLAKYLREDGNSLTIRQALLESPSSLELEKVVEVAAGMPYADFVRARQFEPLGLRSTFFGSELAGLGNEEITRVTKHRDFLHKPALINPVEPATGYNAEGPTQPDPTAIYASAHDVSVWDIGLAGDILITSADLRGILYKPASLPNGDPAPTTGPWFFPGHPGLMIATGSSNGFSSLLSRFTDPSELVCVTLLANREGLDLTQLARKIAGAYDPKLGPPPGTGSRRVQQSPYSVEETISRLKSILEGRGVAIFAEIDHKAEAATVNLDLPPMRELLFGNPAAGTHFMLARPASVLDLPLRAAAWQQGGATWLAATDPVALAEDLPMEKQPTLPLQMRKALDSALLEAVSP